MDPKIIAYDILSSGRPANLAIAVNDRMSDVHEGWSDWQPYGPAFVNGGYFYQAMVRYQATE